jgi:hypothetical protein
VKRRKPHVARWLVLAALAGSAAAAAGQDSSAVSLTVKTKAQAKYFINKHYHATEHWRPLRHVLRFNRVDTLVEGHTLALPSVKDLLRAFGLPARLHEVTDRLVDAWYEFQFSEYTEAKCRTTMSVVREAISAYESYGATPEPAWVLTSLRDSLRASKCPSPEDLIEHEKLIGSGGNALDRAIMNILAWSVELTAKAPPNFELQQTKAP